MLWPILSSGVGKTIMSSVMGSPGGVIGRVETLGCGATTDDTVTADVGESRPESSVVMCTVFRHVGSNCRTGIHIWIAVMAIKPVTSAAKNTISIVAHEQVASKFSFPTIDRLIMLCVIRAKTRFVPCFSQLGSEKVDDESVYVENASAFLTHSRYVLG